jgi:hypothetical protein
MSSPPPTMLTRMLFRQFSDNESFRRWLAETVFNVTYEEEPTDKVAG